MTGAVNRAGGWTAGELAGIIGYGLETCNAKIVRWAMVLLAIEDPGLLEELYPCAGGQGQSP